jgi:hypothetical protein
MRRMTPPDDRLTTQFMRLWREQPAGRSPDWTDANDPDPGITLVQIFGFLAEQIDRAAATLPMRERTTLGRIGSRLMELDRGEQDVSVRIDGVPWRFVDDLSAASADADVFSLDPVSGAIRFGDGTHGRRPPAGASITVTYRVGQGRFPDRAGISVVVGGDGGSTGGELVRPTYFEGRLLAADDLRAEQDYVRAKLRRLHRAALGAGIVSGLELSISTDDDGQSAIVVSPGMAVDARGELIEVPHPVCVALAAGGRPGVILLRYVERATALMPSLSDVDDTPRPSRIAEGYGVSVEDDADAAAVVLGRLARGGDGWRIEGPTG